MNRKQRRKHIKALAKQMTRIKGEYNANMPTEADAKFLIKRYKHERRKGKSSR